MNRGWTIWFLLMLPAFHGWSQTLRVRENVMVITLSRDLSDEALSAFMKKYRLNDVGLWELLHNRKTDSLEQQGWTVIQQKQMFTLSKPMGTVEYPDGKVIFTPVLTPDNWREVSGNRTTFGFNQFNDGEEFTINKNVVQFRLRGFEDADSVRLAGNFTNWQHAAFPMKRTDSGWIADVWLDAGQYYYKFIIDKGDWITDPANLLSENDGRGNENSVFFVPNQHFELKGYEKAEAVFLAGTFNNWSDDDIPMNRTPTGWSKALFIEDGTYTYYYKVDGETVVPLDKDSAVVTIGSPHLFTLPGFTSAKNVALTGNFNHWHQQPLRRNEKGDGWEGSYVLGPGNYRYTFIVDGQPVTDPAHPVIVKDDEHRQYSFLVIGANHTFELRGFTDASEVRVTGDFTDYSPGGIKMEKTRNGWQARVYLAKGKHRYKFIVDGKDTYDRRNQWWEKDPSLGTYSVIWMDPNEVK